MALERSGRRSKVGTLLTAVELMMELDDELSSIQIQDFLEHAGIIVSERTVRRVREALGWTYRRAHYCQMIRSPNIEKRFIWANANVGDDFHNVIWTDETTVQLQTHKRYSCRKKGCLPTLKPRPKHPVKIHVWGGIS